MASVTKNDNDDFKKAMLKTTVILLHIKMIWVLKGLTVSDLILLGRYESWQKTSLSEFQYFPISVETLLPQND